MSAPLTKRINDNSNLESFSFSFFCDCCGKEWVSPHVRFESNGFSEIKHEEAKRLIWEQEHRAAFEKANLEAHLYFNRCSQCGKRVCDECFNMDEQEHCKECSLN